MNNPLDGEYLSGFEKFYFKKVCILSGANASGKTSIGRVLFSIQQFLDRGVLGTNNLKITDKARPAYIEADFFQTHNSKLYRVGFKLIEQDNIVTVEQTEIAAVTLWKTDSCASATKRLDKTWADKIVSLKNSPRYYSTDKISSTEFTESFKNEDFFFGWHYILSENKEVANKISRLEKNVLTAVLKTFDSTIKSVSELTAKDGDDSEVQGYSVTFDNKDKVIIDLDGEIANRERLSRGTYEAVKISHLLSGIIEDRADDLKNEEQGSGIYFLDEKMAYTHTELEKMIVTLIISKLCRYGQFFYTTHNYDILSLDLPAHSFTFTKKINGSTKFIDATEIYKKNDRNLLNHVKNDCFGTVPDISLIEEMIFED